MFKSAPFTSDTFTTSEDGFPVGNRPVYSDGQRAFNKAVVTDGVPFEPSSNLEVTAAGGMDVSVAVGLIIKNGAWGYLDTAKTITLSTSSSDQVIYIGVRAAAADAYFIGDDIAAYTTFVPSTDCAVARIITVPYCSDILRRDPAELTVTPAPATIVRVPDPIRETNI